jgi:hypothetical protein
MAGGSILALLGGSKGKGGSAKAGPPALEPEGGGDEVGDALLEMFDSLKSGDSSGAALAFKRAYHACADEGAGETDLDMGDEEEPEMEL